MVDIHLVEPINPLCVVRHSFLYKIHALRISTPEGGTFTLPLIEKETTPEMTGVGVDAPLTQPTGVASDTKVTQREEKINGKKSDRDINTFTTKADIDAEISRVQDQIRDIQNAQWNAVKAANATVFMKNMGYEGVDVRGTGLDNTAYGSVICDG